VGLLSQETPAEISTYLASPNSSAAKLQLLSGAISTQITNAWNGVFLHEYTKNYTGRFTKQSSYTNTEPGSTGTTHYTLRQNSLKAYNMAGSGPRKDCP
jgi:hypothetical protein